MTYEQDYRWIDILSEITESYNKTYYRSIKRTHGSVKKTDSVELWKLLYQTEQKTSKITSNLPLKYKFKVGDLVRISYLRRQFQREYDERWTRELFVVNQRFIREGIPQYRLKDYAGEIVTGTFYQKQLNKAYEQETYLIDKVITSKGKGQRKRYLVSWKKWPVKYNSWITEDDFRAIKK